MKIFKVMVTMLAAAVMAICLLPGTAEAAPASAPTILGNGSQFNANGTPVTIDAPTKSPGKNRKCMIPEGTTYTNFSKDPFDEGALIYWGDDDASGGYVYAKASVTIYSSYDDTLLDGNTSITMLGGTLRLLYGGGRSPNSSVNGNTVVEISGGTVTSVYGGGAASNKVSGNTNVTISGGTVTYVNAGGSSYNTVEGTANVTVSGGTVSSVTGINSSNSKVCGANITITGGTVNGNVYGVGNNGGTVVKKPNVDDSGNTSVTINGGTVKGNVRGGGLYASAVAGNSAVTISGGTVEGDVSGGASVSDATVSVSGNPSIGSVAANKGIVLSSITGNVATISGALSGSDGAIVLRSPSATTAGTVVAKATTPSHADASKFTLVGIPQGLALNANVLTGEIRLASINAVTVTNGTGGGDYAEGATVTITANTAPSGQRFKEWTTTPDVKYVDSTSATSSTAKFEMPDEAVAATATYENVYTITATMGADGSISPSGMVEVSEGNDQEFIITADGGYQIDYVRVDGTVVGAVASYKFIDVREAHTIHATFKPIPPATFAVTVVSGTADKTTAAQGDTVTITANTATSGQRFKEWTTSDGVTFADSKAEVTTFEMPAKPVTVAATYEAIPPATFDVTVTSGTADKTTAAQGDTVTITANTAPSGQRFKEWTTSDGVTFADSKAEVTTFEMPAKPVTVTATYEAISTPPIDITPSATIIQGNAPGNLRLNIGSAGSPPNTAAHFGSLQISPDGTSFTTVSGGNYTLSYGSIHIALKQSWLNTLAPGTYTLRVNLAGAFSGTSLTTRLTVTAQPAPPTPPKTGDGSMPLLWLSLLLICGAGAVLAGVKAKGANKRC